MIRIRNIVLMLLALSWTTTIYASEKDSLTSGFGEARYTLRCHGEYTYNKTWGSAGNLSLQGIIPLHRYIDMQAGIQLSTANVYTGVVLLRPKYAVPVGEIFADAEWMYKAIVRDRQWTMDVALSVGYRMDYISLQVGWIGSWTNFFGKTQSMDGCVFEPYNVLYRLEIFCRPQHCPWNLRFCAANYDDWQIERMTQPLFMVGGRYDIDSHWRIETDVELKPTGMFHMNATFYGATARAGFAYRF